MPRINPKYKRPNSKQTSFMKLRSDNRCEICGHTFDDKDYKMHVDHNHKTGEVRGLLCHYCNIGLGYFKDRIALLQVAADYLIKYAPPNYFKDD